MLAIKSEVVGLPSVVGDDQSAKKDSVEGSASQFQKCYVNFHKFQISIKRRELFGF
jgi:hypothetical protein